MTSAKLWLAGMAVMIAAAMTGCGGSTQALPPQHWHGLDVRVEVRPSPLNDADEFLVMVTRSNGKPGYGLVISLRGSDQAPWKQAIEDGRVGVYRTAIKVGGKKPVLQMKIKLDDNEGVLHIPLRQPNAPSAP